MMTLNHQFLISSFTVLEKSYIFFQLAIFFTHSSRDFFVVCIKFRACGLAISHHITTLIAASEYHHL
ncbi:MAG: hypothetical protein WCG25_03670 [bacterium]